MEKIVITGSSGFVGTNFIKNSEEFDITEVDLLIQKVDDIDFTGKSSVLHLAALVHQMKGANEEEYFKVNRDLAYDVAKKAKEKGVKHFVLMSTVKVYGESTTNLPPLSENTLCKPLDAYGKSKFEAEKLIQSLQDENFQVAIVRSPLVYGVGVKANMFSLVKLVDKFPFLPLGGIKNKRSMVYVENLVALIKQIIFKKASGIFLAGDPTLLSTTQLVQLIAKSLNKRIILVKIPQFVINIAAKFKPSIVDRLYGFLELENSTTKSKLDFISPYSSEEGIQKMVAWYQTIKYR
jgi:nucleoside-diphosphate-sugar epimerase